MTASKYVTDPRKDVEDTVAAFLLLEGGASLQLEVSWALLLEKNFPYLNLFGTDGAALLNPFRIHKELNREPPQRDPRARVGAKHLQAIL